MLSSRVERSTVALLVLLFVVLAAGGLREQSVTVDEYAHLPAGCAALRRGSLDLYAKNPPLVRYLLAAPALARGASVPEPDLPTQGAGWDPWRYGDAFLEANAPTGGLGRYPALLGAARLAGLTLGVALLLLVHRWARTVNGPAGGILSLYLLALSPTLLAHAPLATVDVGATFFFLLAAWLCSRVLAVPGGAGQWALAGAAVGVAVSAKFTAVILLALFPLWAWFAGRGRPAPGTPARRLGRAVAFGLAALLAIHAAYQFDRPLRTMDRFSFASRAGRAAESILPGWTPVPLPAAMVAGLDGQALDLEQAEMPNYLNGRWSRAGWWYYYPEALLLKTPLALWGLVLLAGTFAVRRRRPEEGQRSSILARAMLGSAAAALVMASMTSHLNIGIRYLLPALAILHLLLGGLAPAVARAGRAERILLAALLLGYGAASVAAYPRYLTFFSSVAGGQDGGHRYLLNSNNDWGQDLGRLATWLEEEEIEGPIGLAYFGHMDPARHGIDYFLAPDHPQPGVHAVSLNFLLGMPYVVVDHGRWLLLGEDLTRPQSHYAWLREREAVARIGGTIWVYRIPSEEPTSDPRGGPSTPPGASPDDS